MDVLFLIGQSGSGKTVLARRLEEAYRIPMAKSVTTRPRRHSDKEDDYEFVTQEEFLKLLTGGGLMEHTTYCNQFYGYREPVENCVMPVEPSGYVMAKKWCQDNAVRSATVYLSCSEAERIRRMMKRGDSREKAMERVANDRYFDEFLHPKNYDWKIDTTGLSNDETAHAVFSRLKSMQFFTFDPWSIR